MQVLVVRWIWNSVNVKISGVNKNLLKSSFVYINKVCFPVTAGTEFLKSARNFRFLKATEESTSVPG